MPRILIADDHRAMRGPHVPRIVFLTALDDPEVATTALALGAFAVVSKHNMAAELIPTITRALNIGPVHAVYFYEDAPALSSMVARFIGDGLTARQPSLVIATPSHSAAILERLTEMALEPEKRIEQGDLVVLDAGEVLGHFMADDMPRAQCFQDTMIPILDRMGRGGKQPVVRAYGEMVDLLWNSKREAAALSLETQWNHLATRRSFSLLCGYSRDGVGDGAGLNEICHQHNHVLSASDDQTRTHRAHAQ